jgi:ATP-dependent 26S proteasome regulatory subunit
MRRRLFELHLPNRERVFADLNILATEAKGLSGGDILNVCLNAIYAGSTADDAAQWKVTGTDLLAEITKVKSAQSDHRTTFCREDTHSA